MVRVREDNRTEFFSILFRIMSSAANCSSSHRSTKRRCQTTKKSAVDVDARRCFSAAAAVIVDDCRTEQTKNDVSYG